MIHCYDIQARINDMADSFVRVKLSKAIFKIIPRAFGFKQDQTGLMDFNTLRKIEKFLMKRSWGVQVMEKDVKVGRVPDSPNTQTEEAAKDILKQAMKELKENKMTEINQLKTK